VHFQVVLAAERHHGLNVVGLENAATTTDHRTWRGKKCT
jgi:hypothetical protein